MKNTVQSAAATLTWAERNHGIGSREHLAASLAYEEAKISRAIALAVKAQPALPMENRARLIEQIRKWTVKPTAVEATRRSVRFRFSPRIEETGTVTRKTATTLQVEFPTQGLQRFTLRPDGKYRRVGQPNDARSLEILLDPYGLL